MHRRRWAEDGAAFGACCIAVACGTTGKSSVAGVERSETRGAAMGAGRAAPDFAALHPGYGGTAGEFSLSARDSLSVLFEGHPKRGERERAAASGKAESGLTRIIGWILRPRACGKSAVIRV